jgi:hypothetical protein
MNTENTYQPTHLIIKKSENTINGIKLYLNGTEIPKIIKMKLSKKGRNRTKLSLRMIIDSIDVDTDVQKL